MRLAGVMVDARRGEVEHNMGRLGQLLREAAAQGAQVACTQEGCLEGYVVQQPGLCAEEYARLAEPIPQGPRFTEVQEWCKELGLSLILGLAENAGQAVYNSAALIDGQGQLVGVYRKVHDLGRESLNRQGDALPVFETEHGRFGVLICSDRHFPEAARVLALQGAQVVFVPAWGFRGDLNTAVLRTRAHENRFYVVFVHAEECCIVDPQGRVVAQEVGTGRILMCDLDVEAVAPAAHEYLSTRRPDLYGALVEQPGGRD